MVTQSQRLVSEPWIALTTVVITLGLSYLEYRARKDKEESRDETATEEELAFKEALHINISELSAKLNKAVDEHQSVHYIQELRKDLSSLVALLEKVTTENEEAQHN